jgi:hypothetical protein
MDNIDVKVTGNKAVITIDLSKKGPLSQSGKNFLVASTHGSYPLGNGVQFSMNAYVNNPDYRK